MSYIYDYMVQSGIPCPRKRKRSKSKQKNVHYPFPDMKIGDCFFHNLLPGDVPERISRRIKVAGANYNRRIAKGSVFTTREYHDQDGRVYKIGCWRTK